jgi:hypothetical protein
MSDQLKTAICDALAAFIRQRPGLEFGNYGDVSSYRSEMRSIAKDKRDAEALLQAVRWRDSITGADIVKASEHAFSGRLEIKVSAATAKLAPIRMVPVNGPKVTIGYTAGQYFPTEYRKAVAAVCASVLWNYTREHAMPPPVASKTGDETYDGTNGGDWLRRHFRREFGSAIQRRWFN